MSAEDNPNYFEGVEIPTANVTSDGDGGISCSIEETNRLRILLGMKPLSAGKDDPVVNREKAEVEQLKAYRQQEAAKQNAVRVKEQLEEARTRRLAQPKAVDKTLGEADVEDDDDVTAWVRKSREQEKTGKTEKIQTSKGAKPRKQLLIEQEDDEDDEDEAEQKVNHVRKPQQTSRYNKNELRGLKIGHDVSSLLSNDGVILTLADTSVLANGGVNDEDDILENVNMSELEKHQDAVKKSKMKAYNPYGDEEMGESENKSILSHYDEENKKHLTLIGEDGLIQYKEKKASEVRARLQANTTQLESSLSIKAEMKPEPKEEFRQPVKKAEDKKRKLRKKKLTTEDIHESVLRSLEEEGNNETEKTADIVAKSTEFDSLDKATKQKKLQQKMKSVTKSILGADDGSDDSGDDELARSLARARHLAALRDKKVVKSEDNLVSTLRSLPTQPKPVSGDMADSGAVFSVTEEYIRKIGSHSHTDEPSSPGDMREESHPNGGKAQDSEAASQDDEGDAQMNGDEAEVNSDSSEDEEKQEDLYYDDEPDLNHGGLAAALALARRRGDLNKQLYGGRTKDRIELTYGPTVSDGKKEPKLEQRDEFGRILTPKEAFRLLSYKFHGRRPGKRSQEKRMRKLEEQMKLEKIANEGTASVTSELLKAQQENAHVPYLVLSVGKKAVLGSMPTKDEDGSRYNEPVPLEKSAGGKISLQLKDKGGKGSKRK